MEEDHKEMPLFSSIPHYNSSSSQPPSIWPYDSSSSMKYRSSSSFDHFESPSLDLKLSISVTTPIVKPPNSDRVMIRKVSSEVKKKDSSTTNSCVEALKWEAAEQIRLASMEKCYAERVRELTRREMELAQAEFARARCMWERAREEVERVEKMKEMATRKIDSTCMEITCQSCSLKFTP